VAYEGILPDLRTGNPWGITSIPLLLLASFCFSMYRFLELPASCDLPRFVLASSVSLRALASHTVVLALPSLCGLSPNALGVTCAPALAILGQCLTTETAQFFYRRHSYPFASRRIQLYVCLVSRAREVVVMTTSYAQFVS
jgi:hypothetical protein